MTYKEILKYLSICLLNDLPGLPIQLKMAPPHRNSNAERGIDYKKSGVALLLFQEANEWIICLMQRTKDGSVHSGQISLPGGKYDESDYTLLYTAIRELKEELGVSIDSYQIVGGLTPLYIPPSNFLVYPFVFVARERPTFHLSIREVDHLIFFPLSQLLSSDSKNFFQVSRSDNRLETIETPSYSFKDYPIWGATAMILREFEELFHVKQ